MKTIKLIFSIFVLLIIATNIQAQQRTDMVVYKNGNELFRTNIENIDSIKFVAGGNFCSYLKEETINETIPFIDEFLVNLSENLSDEEKLTELTEWLNLQYCIIESEVRCVSCISGMYQPTLSEISFSFNENGIVKDFMLDVLMGDTLKTAYIHRQYEARTVLVKTKRYFPINNVFDFINSLEHDVKEIRYGTFISNMPPDSLQYILDRLNEKPYTNDGVWNVTGYLHYATNQIYVFPYFFNIKNIDYQNDWLETMEEFQLVEDMSYEHSGYQIKFKVREGTEKYWEARFREYDFVEWVQLKGTPN